MVVTIEPGVYIPTDADVPSDCHQFRGIGIRIEDDVLISPRGQPPIVLTQLVPKEVHDIEAECRGTPDISL